MHFDKNFIWCLRPFQAFVEYLFLAFSTFLLQPPQIQLRTSRASPAADQGGGGGGGEGEVGGGGGVGGGEGGGGHDGLYNFYFTYFR